MSGLNCGMPSIISWPILRDLSHVFIAIGDSWAKEGVKRLADENVISGESGAAGIGGFYALQNFIKNCPASAELASLVNFTSTSVLLTVSTEGDTDQKLYIV